MAVNSERHVFCIVVLYWSELLYFYTVLNIFSLFLKFVGLTSLLVRCNQAESLVITLFFLFTISRPFLVRFSSRFVQYVQHNAIYLIMCCGNNCNKAAVASIGCGSEAYRWADKLAVPAQKNTH